MKKLNVARMGSNDSKYGQQRNAVEKGDRVVAGMNNEFTGIVIKVTRREIVVELDNGMLRAFTPEYVSIAVTVPEWVSQVTNG